METKLKLLKTLSKKGHLKILLALNESPKKWSELSNLLYPRDLHNGIKELIEFGMVQATIIRDTPTGSKAYELTPLGKKIVQHIEEMEREFEEYHRKRSFPDTVEEFIDKELEEE